VLREEKVNGLAVFIHRPIQIAPLALHFHVRLVHAPADPHRALATVKGFFQERALFDHPPIDGRVIHVDPTFEHKFFDVACVQGVGDIPTDAHQNDVLWEMGPFEADRHRLSSFAAWIGGETIPQIASNENLRQNPQPTLVMLPVGHTVASGLCHCGQYDLAQAMLILT
jgi:hypothetical protein